MKVGVWQAKARKNSVELKSLQGETCMFENLKT